MGDFFVLLPIEIVPSNALLFLPSSRNGVEHNKQCAKCWLIHADAMWIVPFYRSMPCTADQSLLCMTCRCERCKRVCCMFTVAFGCTDGKRQSAKYLKWFHIDRHSITIVSECHKYRLRCAFGFGRLSARLGSMLCGFGVFCVLGSLPIFTHSTMFVHFGCGSNLNDIWCEMQQMQAIFMDGRARKVHRLIATATRYTDAIFDEVLKCAIEQCVAFVTVHVPPYSHRYLEI